MENQRDVMNPVLYLRIPVKHGKKRATVVEKDFPGGYSGLQFSLKVVQERPVRDGGRALWGAKPKPK